MLAVPKGEKTYFPPFLSTIGERQRSHLIHLAPISRLVPPPSCIFLFLSISSELVWEVAFVIPLLLLRLIPRCVCRYAFPTHVCSVCAYIPRAQYKGRKDGRRRCFMQGRNAFSSRENYKKQVKAPSSCSDTSYVCFWYCFCGSLLRRGT